MADNKENKENKIPGGYILLSRKIIESGIMDKPPLYMKVWIYLLSKTQWKPYKGLKRGQLYTTIREIREAISWHEGARKVTPTKDQVYRVLAWLRGDHGRNGERNADATANATMIATANTTRGYLITIDKYCLYQDPKNYERNDEHNDERAPEKLRAIPACDVTNKEGNKKDNKGTPADGSTDAKRTHSERNAIKGKEKKGKETENNILRVFEFYNSHRDGIMPEAKALSDRRRSAIRARIRDHGLDTVIEVLGQACESDFLTGRNNGFKCGIDWLMLPNNFLKVMEGNYENNKNNNGEINAAWIKLIDAVGQYGQYGKDDAKQNLDEKTFKIAENIGWCNLCTADNINEYKKEFDRLWKQG